MNLSVWVERNRLTNRYSVRYRDPETGLKCRVKCFDRTQMLATKARIQSMLINRQAGHGEPEAIPLVIFEQYLSVLSLTGRRLSTIGMKRKNLVPFLETLFKLNQLSKEAIQLWIRGMQAKYKIDTIAIRLRDLRAFINWLIKEQKIMENPFKGLSIPASNFVGRRLTLEEIQHIYNSTEGLFRVFFIVALETGARHGELLAAEWNEIDLKHKAWFIPALKCKTRINRTVPLSDRAVKALEELHRAGNRVFEGMDRFRAQRLWKQALHAAGVMGRVRIHDIRHTFASNWQGRGASLKAIAGWTTDAMLSKYTHTELSFLSEEVQKTSQSFWGKFGANEPNIHKR